MAKRKMHIVSKETGVQSLCGRQDVDTATFEYAYQQFANGDDEGLCHFCLEKMHDVMYEDFLQSCNV